jgi:hypothetical protein
MVDETPETTTIRIKVKTHDKLKTFALYVETMDDVILRLLREEKERANTKKVSYEGAI